MAEISVIVPVYRAEGYLPACIDSILNQTYADFELILVDDGSPDRCGEICEDYAQTDSRITVLHQKNQGQAAARNHALEKTSAPWVCFVDSDDLIHPQTLERLYRAARETNAPMSQCRMLEAPELPESFFAPASPAVTCLEMKDETIARMYQEGTYPAWVACGKLIRRDLIERHPFVPGRVFEDNEAVCHWLAGEKLADVPAYLYFYRTNPESTTKTGFSLKKLDFLWALESITRFYGSIGFAKTHDLFLDRYIDECADHYRAVTCDLGKCEAAQNIKRNLRAMLKVENRALTKPQFEQLLDAMHPRLIRVYWPVEGVIRTLKEDGMGGIMQKLKKHLGGTQP